MADPMDFVYKWLPQVSMELARRYFRLKIEGTEYLPRRGAALIAPNHSGYSGFDAMLLSHEIYKATGRVPRMLAHRFWFMTKYTAVPAEKVGFIKASMNNGLSQLKKNNLVVVFPEGESGNFKPTAKRYHLQPFKSGIIRMALKREVPIIPTLILGAEESHINLAELRLNKILPGVVLPLPLNLIPLPAKWKIRFLPPVHLPYKPAALDDDELISDLLQDLRERMQTALSEEVSKRGSIFFD